MQPEAPQPNYDFIMNSGNEPKKSPLGGPSSTTKRALVVIGGLLLLLIIGAVFMSFLSNAGAAFKKDAMLSVLQDQTEIVRLSDAGVENGVDQTTKNFAITTKLGMQSEQTELLTFLDTNGFKPDPKSLPLKLDGAADTQLADAQSASNFDSTYESIMKRKLETYRNDLQAAYEGSNEEGRTLLNGQYETAGLLLNQLAAN